MTTFGGIWRDGAFEQPSEDCLDSSRQLVAIGKKTGSLSLMTLRSNYAGEEAFKDWLKDFFWLDVRMPKVLRPKEAFDLMRVFHRNLVRIHKTKPRDGMVMDFSLLGAASTPIEWGEMTVYQPPKDESIDKPIALTKANYKKYIHTWCKFGVVCEGQPEIEGMLVGISPDGNAWVFEGKGPSTGLNTLMYAPMQLGATVLSRVEPLKKEEPSDCMSQINRSIEQMVLKALMEAANRKGKSTSFFVKE